MSKLLNKPTPTVAELAKKYKVSVVEVKKELLRGIKVEKEHTNNPKIAREIALDHLGEKLDYYKRLKKVDEETGVGSVRGLGNITGDPAVGSNDYCSTNSLAYDPFNGARLKFIDKSHNKLHINLFKAYDPKKENKNFMNEGISAGPEREIPIIGDLTGSSRKVMKVDEVKLPKVPEKVKKRVKGAVAATMTAANIATGADIYDRASRGVGSPARDIAAAASGLPGKVGYAAMGTNWTVKGFDKAREHIKTRQKQMKEQGSPAVPGRYTERPMYEKKNGDVLPSGEIERGIYEAKRVRFISKQNPADLPPRPVDYKPGDFGSKLAREGGIKYPGKKKPSKPIKEEQDKDMNEDWSDVKHQNPSGGLKKSGVMAYRRENPGSKLQTAVTTKPSKLKPGSKAANRRKSFCARMGGMKKRLTSAKTARDPDSRINKALRKWNCEESIINELKAETLGSYVKKSAASRKKSLEGNKPDIKTWSKREHGIRTAIKKLTKEETKMQNKDLIDEALVNILENNLVDMKENLMTALQEKAMEKLEERKKEISANYFAQ